MAELPVEGRLLPVEVNYVIFHGVSCPDGFSAKVIAQSVLGDKATYFGTSHGRDPPTDLEGKNVLILDFSYNKPTLDYLLTKVKNLLILDHHRSAQKDLEELPAKHKIFNMNKSGASLTWDYFYPNAAMPYFFQLIEEHDIWKESAALFCEFGALSQIIPQTYANYWRLSQLTTPDMITHVYAESKNLLKMTELQIDWAVEHAWIHFQKIGKSYYLVATVNSTILPSEIGAALVRKHPIVDFAAIYTISSNGETKFSLRSTDAQADTIPVAKNSGGGGHRNATGCSVQATVSKLPGPSFEIDLDCFKTLTTVTIGSEVYLSIYADQHKHKIAAYLMQTRDGKIKQWQALAKIFDLELKPTVTDSVIVEYYSPSSKKIERLCHLPVELSLAELEVRRTKLGLDPKNVFITK